MDKTQEDFEEASAAAYFSPEVVFNEHTSHAYVQGYLSGKASLTTQLEEAVKERDQHRKDLEEAAGSLMIDIPIPGTDMAKVMRTNTIIRGERNAYRKALEYEAHCLGKCVATTRIEVALAAFLQPETKTDKP
jgi:hypothetical protein